MDDLDIYNDLDSFHEQEQRKSKELLDLEEKCEETKKEIEAVQKQNRKLEKKIEIMKTNFQCLLNTARAEINRKDRLIADLRKEKDDICFRRKNVLQKRENEYKQKPKWQQSGDVQNFYETNGTSGVNVFGAEVEASLNVVSSSSKFQEQLRIHEEENANRISSSSWENDEIHSKTKHTRDDHREKKTNELPANERTQQRSHEKDNQRTREHDRDRNRDRDRDRDRNSNRDHERKDEQVHRRNTESSREKSKHSKYAREHEDRHEHQSRLDRDTIHTNKHSDSRNNQKDNKRRYEERDQVNAKEKSHKSERHETDKNKSGKKHEELRHSKSNKTVESAQSSTKSAHQSQRNEQLQHAETNDIHSSKSCNSDLSKAITQTIEERAAQQIEVNMLIDSSNNDELHLSTPKKVALFDAVFGTSTQRVGNDNEKLFTNVMEILQKGVNAESKTPQETEEQSITEFKAKSTKSQLSENENLSATEMAYYFDDNKNKKSDETRERKIDNVVNIFKPFGGHDENCIPGLSVTDELLEVEVEERKEKEESEQEKTESEDVKCKQRKTDGENNKSELKTIEKSKDMQSKKMQKTESQEEIVKDAEKELSVCEELQKKEQNVKDGNDLPDKDQTQSIKKDTERQQVDGGKEIVCLESIDEDVLECEVDEHMECLDFSAEDVKDSKSEKENDNSHRDECENDPFKLTEMIESDEESMEEIMNKTREVSASEDVEESEEKEERVRIIEDIRLPTFYDSPTQMETAKQSKDEMKDNVKCDRDNGKVASINTCEDVSRKTVEDILSDDDFTVHNDDDDDTISFIHNDEDNDGNNRHVCDEFEGNTKRHVLNEDEDTISFVHNYNNNKGDNNDDNTKEHVNNDDVNDNTERHVHNNVDDNVIEICNVDSLHNDDDGATQVHNEVNTNVSCDKDNAKNDNNNECINMHNDDGNRDDDHQNDIVIDDTNACNVNDEDIHHVDDAKNTDDVTRHACPNEGDIHDNDEVNVEGDNVDVLSDKELYNEDNTKDQYNNHNAELCNEDNANNGNFSNNDNAVVVHSNDVDNADNDDQNNEDNHLDINDNNDMKIESHENVSAEKSLTVATTTTNAEQVTTFEEEHSPLHEIEETNVEAEMDVMFKSMEDETEKRIRKDDEDLQQNVNSINSLSMDENDVTTSEKIESENITKTPLPANESYEVTTTTNNNDLEMIQSSQESDEIVLLENSSPEKIFSQNQISNDTRNKTSKRKSRMQNNINSKKRKLHDDEVEVCDAETVIPATTATTVIHNGTKERTPPRSDVIIEEETSAVESPGPMRKIRRSGKMRWQRHGRRALESSSEDEAPLSPVKVSTTKRIVKRRHTIAYNMEELQVCDVTEPQEETKYNEITTTTIKTADITAPSATPVHEIFQRDVEDAVTLETVNAHVEEDAKFQEIDSRMQSMFQSPAHEGITLSHMSFTPADKCADSSRLLNGSNDRLNLTNLTNLTINETNSFSDQNGTVSTSLLADVSCASSVNGGNSSLETKRISLGTSDYRFEKMSDNVVKLFITRKRSKKKKTKTNNETNLNV